MVLVDFYGSIVGSLNSLDSLDTVGAGELGPDCGLVSIFGISVTSG